jgi:predicted transcriptional regulator
MQPTVTIFPSHGRGQALTLLALRSRLTNMEVNFRPETESRLQELASKSGRPPSDLIEDAMAGYLQEVAQVREMLDGRYDDLKSGHMKPADGEAAFAKLRQKSKERRARS